MPTINSNDHKQPKDADWFRHYGSDAKNLSEKLNLSNEEKEKAENWFNSLTSENKDNM